MIPRGLSKRYATALFNAALKTGVADQVDAEAKGIRAVFKEHPALKTFLLSPQVLTKTKHDVIKTVLKGKTTDLFTDFLLLLVDKKRFSFVEEIAEGYTYLYERHKGIVDVQVTTAVPLDEPLQRKTIATLERQTGKKIRLVAVVDPRIIGGIVLVMGDKIIDGSVRFRMEKLRRELDAIRV